MAVVVEMPDGTEKEFPDISSAKAYKKSLLADPNVGGALKLTGDPDEAKKFLDIQGKGQDIRKGELETQKLERDLQDPSTTEMLKRNLSTYEGALQRSPPSGMLSEGESGPFAIAQGKWNRFKGVMGYEPYRSTIAGAGDLASSYRNLKEKGVMTEQDFQRAMDRMPQIDDPMETQREKLRQTRAVLKIPGGESPWEVMTGAAGKGRYAIQPPARPQGDIK